MPSYLVRPLRLMMLCFCGPLLAVEPATIVTDSPLYQRPAVQSALITELKAGTRVDALARSGGWKQVRIDQHLSGWVRSYQVRAGEVPVSEGRSENSGFLGGLANLSRRVSSLFSGSRERQNTYSTATIGVRGLSEEQIRDAEPDLAELARMEKYRSNHRQARAFARQGKIKARQLSHMPPSSREQ